MNNFYIRYKILQYKFIGVNRSMKIEKARKNNGQNKYGQRIYRSVF